jgi:hypothetical protein
MYLIYFRYILLFKRTVYKKTSIAYCLINLALSPSGVVTT